MIVADHLYAVEAVKANLKKWPYLVDDIKRLENMIEKCNDDIKRLQEKMMRSHILRYENLDMPFRSNGISDPTGEQVSSIIDAQNEIRAKILSYESKLAQKKSEVHAIETSVSLLKQRDAEIIRRYYLHRERWEYICRQMKIKKSRLYQILDESVERLANL